MDAELLERAARFGIETQYHDGTGQLRTVAGEVLGRLVGALGRETPAHARILPPSVIARGDARVRVRLKVSDDATIAWAILADQQMMAQGQSRGAELNLSVQLPKGIYRLRVAADEALGKRVDEAALILAPHKACQGVSEKRMWALGVQLYAVRSERNWGHSDFSDLVDLIDMAADHGAAGVGLNPLHALFEGEASPYFPNTRLFLNPLYIDVDAIPEFPGRAAAGLEGEIARLRAGDVIDYEGVTRTKMRALKAAHAAFRNYATAERRAAFDRFRARHSFPLVGMAAGMASSATGCARCALPKRRS
jgi:4-alpha-glucanotransferase